MMFHGILKKQLLLKNIITEDDWKKWSSDIVIEYARDNHFTELKNAELLRERIQTLEQIQQFVGEYYSKEWVMKNILMFSDEDIENLKKEIEDEGPKEEDGDEQQ
jgi:hypothetical protein